MAAPYAIHTWACYRRPVRVLWAEGSANLERVWTTRIPRRALAVALDMDIEGDSLTNAVSVDRRDKALHLAQQCSRSGYGPYSPIGR